MTAALPRSDWWQGRRVFVTGHTGFIGGWLCTWLAKLGAHVSGFALAPATTPNFHDLTGIAARLQAATLGDIRDYGALAGALAAARPQVVFHLAAQPLVRDAYRDPVATFATNALGTVHLLEASRACAGLERLVIFTTDKVYRNDQSGRAFVESERLGGNEPYSASKAAAEHAAAAYWETYLRRARPRPAMATVRAGNVVGGGDWSADRLLPDAMRAFSAGRPLAIRSPGSTRPWQHVLDAVRGTLVLAERMEAADVPAEEIAWNFGPASGVAHPVSDVADAAVRAWGAGAAWKREEGDGIPESRALALSSGKAAARLGWRCAWDMERSVAESVVWYRAALDSRADLVGLTHRQIDAHVADAARPSP